MSPNNEDPNFPDIFRALLRELAQSTASTLKVHSDMMMSIDTKLGDYDAKLDRLTATVNTLAENSKRDAENIRALARIAGAHERIGTLEGDQPKS